MVKVTVPATSANIGPGFDTLGLALNLHNVYTFEKQEDLIIEGCPKIFENKENLVYKSFEITANKLGKEVNGLKISMNTKIPISRGLGSSAACIVAGVFGANALYDGNLSVDEMFKIAVMIEGHPDNIAPCVYGGLTASLVHKGNPYTMKYKLSDKLKFCALIPDFVTSTEQARKVLPKMINFEDAVFNISRVSVLLKALEKGNIKMISIALRDKLHQKYRIELIHECDEVTKICFEDGSSALYISGSGPTIINIVDDDKFPERIKNSIGMLKHNWEIKLLNVDKKGTKVEIL